MGRRHVVAVATAILVAGAIVGFALAFNSDTRVTVGIT